MALLEILSYTLQVRVDCSQEPHALLSEKMFNYGDSFYVKYKNHTPESLHDELKALDELDIYLESNRDGYYKFFILTKDKKVATTAFSTVIRLCKVLHNNSLIVDAIMNEKYIAESPTVLSV